MAKLQIGVNDLATTFPELAAQWHPDKKGDLLSSMFTAGSTKKVWWLCNKCGHEWNAVINSRVQGRGCPECAKKRQQCQRQKALLAKFGSLAEHHPDLLDEWDYERNEKQPEEFLSGSDKKVQWVCKTCGHHWSMSIYCRTKQKQGCPKCAQEKRVITTQKVFLASRKLLADQYPELAAQWHPDKNGDLRPSMVTAHSKKKVWWLGKCGHEWNAEIYSRTAGRGCPYCANKKLLRGFNDLLTLYPQIASEWCSARNKPLTPSEVIAGSHKKVWWKCNECGCEWVTEIRRRALGNGCPQCAKNKMGDTFRRNKIDSGATSLQEAHPELSCEWDYEKNQPYTPSDFTVNSSKRVFWKCCICGFEWKTSISNRTAQKTKCPVCMKHRVLTGFNDLATIYPNLASEWHPNRNLPLTPQTVSAANNKLIWWICQYGHDYQCRIIDRAKGVGCSECSKRFHTSLREKAIVYYLEKNAIEVKCSYHAKWLGRAEIDVFLPDKNIGIEYDGQRYHQNIEKDIRKDELCQNNHITLIRIREPKCPLISREAPTFTLTDLSNAALSAVIQGVLNYLDIPNTDIDVDRDIQSISALYRSSATSGNLRQVYPKLAKEFLSSRNNDLLPENIPSTYSKEKYYWKCSACGYEWEAALGERINGTGCPACAGKVIIAGLNDLATTNPDLLKEWHPTRNGDVTPQQVSKGSDYRAWWKCSVCGYEWQVRIKNRVHGSGCNRCAANKRSASLRKKVYQYSLSGEFVQEYDGVAAAAEATGISKSAIRNASNPNIKLQTAGGYRWSYQKIDYPN